MFEVSTHDQKFDRQMRLWGGHGQQKLEEAHICCLGSGPTASECLKNLVLPNVGEFTIIDDAITCEADLGNNFFVDDNGLGKPRAGVVSELLVEMNSSVKGNPVIKNPSELIASDPDFFKTFSLVIACNLPQKSLHTLAMACYNNNIPVVVLSAYGLLGYARLQLPEHAVIELHYENDRYDLFVHPEQLGHFPELKAYIDGFGNLDEIKDGMDHAHIPYIVILSKAIDAWIAKEGSPPKGWDQQKLFKQSIKDMANVYDGDGAEENFIEAVEGAHRVYTKPSLERLSQLVLDDPKATNLTANSDNFWILIAAVKRYIANEGKGCLPCSVKIPDMTSTPDSYVRLGQIYKTRAIRDEGLIYAHAKAILSELKMDGDSISKEEVTYLVKNLRGVTIIRTGTLAEECDAKTFKIETVTDVFEDWVEPPPEGEKAVPRVINWYFAYRVVHQFYSKNGRYPGTGSDVDVDSDSKELITLQTALYTELGITEKVEEDCLRAMSRFGATEIHNIAAFIGGVGSQIILKTLIKQYLPLDNTFIFNGSHGAGQSFKF